MSYCTSGREVENKDNLQELQLKSRNPGASTATDWPRLKFKLYYDRPSVGQSVLVSGTPFGPATNFCSFLELFLYSYWFNDVGRAFSDEKSDL
jgi:hypothetical protein